MFFVGISNGQVIFNVAEDLVDEVYEAVKPEDVAIKKTYTQFLIQLFTSISLSMSFLVIALPINPDPPVIKIFIN